MRRFKFLALLAAFAVMMTCTFAQAAESRTISVDGTSTLKIAPDKATVNVRIETTAKDAKDASAQNAVIMNRIQNSLMALSITKDKMKTTNYSLSPNYDYNDGRNKLTGYTVSNEILVIVDDINKVGNVIDTSINAGANSIGSVEFGLKDSDGYKEKALREAVLDARRKADTIAAALGKTIVNVQSVSANNSYVEARSYNNAMYTALKAADSAGASSPIQAGDISVKANVNIVFEMN